MDSVSVLVLLQTVFDASLLTINNVPFTATDLPAARWEALDGVKKQQKLQRGMPKQFF